MKTWWRSSPPAAGIVPSPSAPTAPWVGYDAAFDVQPGKSWRVFPRQGMVGAKLPPYPAAGTLMTMKISKIETFRVHAGWNSHTFVKVWTDDGLCGIGQAYSAGPDEAVVEVIRDFETWLAGQDPFAIEHLWALMYNGTRFPPGVVVGAAISGIEQALWDIKGKALGVPVYQLLGGKCRDKIKVYQGVYDDTPQLMGEKAAALVKKYGY